MPFTPFHLGPSSFIGLLLFKFIDLPTFLIASIIVDIEPFLVLFFNLDYPLHGFFHGFLGGSILAVITAIILYLLRNEVKKIMAFFKLSQESSLKKILWSSFLGVYTHILLDASVYHFSLDSFSYQDILRPFYPFYGNPFFGWITLEQVYLFCNLSFLLGILLYFIRLRNLKK